MSNLVLEHAPTERATLTFRTNISFILHYGLIHFVHVSYEICQIIVWQKNLKLDI